MISGKVQFLNALDPLNANTESKSEEYAIKDDDRDPECIYVVWYIVWRADI